MIERHEVIIIDGDKLTLDLLNCFFNREQVQDQVACLAEMNSFSILTDEKIHSLKPKFIVFNYQSCIYDLKKNIKRLRKKIPAAKFIACFFAGNPFEIELLLKAGVNAILSTQHRMTDLLDAFDELETNDYFLNDAVDSDLIRKAKRLVHMDDNGLSLLEIAVIKLLSTGYSRESIGRLLCREKHTIENDISIIHSKIGAKNDAQIIRYALLSGHVYQSLNHNFISSHPEIDQDIKLKIISNR